MAVSESALSLTLRVFAQCQLLLLMDWLLLLYTDGLIYFYSDYISAG